MAIKKNAEIMDSAINVVESRAESGAESKGRFVESNAESNAESAGRFVESSVESNKTLAKSPPNLEQFFSDFCAYIGEDSAREGLLKTPMRVLQSWEQLFGGYKKNPLTLLDATQYSENYDEMVVLKDIEFYSMCEHHILPFFGSVNIGYIPNSKVVGISHLVELVEIFTRRLQIQERLNEQITQSIWSALNPKGVMVAIKATHLCMAMQGKKNATIVTSSVRGTFKKDARSRAEFMAHIK